MLTITLKAPIARGSSRQLTASECAQLRKQSQANPYPGKTWKIARNNDGFLSLIYMTMTDGATFPVQEQ